MNVKFVNKTFKNISPEKRIQKSYKHFKENLVASTSFGKYSAIIIHMLQQCNLEIPIIFVDIGTNSKTYEFKNKLEKLLSPNIKTFYPQKNMTDKIEPFERGLKELKAKAWISGIMAHETSWRRQLPFIIQRKDDIYKIHPILDWTNQDCENYLKKHNLPKNTNYFENNLECGIHLSNL